MPILSPQKGNIFVFKSTLSLQNHTKRIKNQDIAFAMLTRNKLLFFFCSIVIHFMVFGCNSPEEIIVGKAPETATIEREILTNTPIPTKISPATETPYASPIPSPSPTIVVSSTSIPFLTETVILPTSSPTNPPISPTPSGAPTFENLRFASSPTDKPRRAFGYETDEVYALWEYSNMHENIIVRREWTLANDKIIREEPWDVEVYGDSGTVTDIFIYDYISEGGLQSGLHSLDLYIDDQRIIFAPFSINGYVSTTHKSTGQRVFVSDNRFLILEEIDGSQRQITEALEILQVSWIPNSQYLLFTDLDRTEQIWHSSMGIEQTMWIVDSVTGQQSIVGDNLHSLKIAPNGNYLAAYEGSDWYDACGFDRRLQFFQLVDGEVTPFIELTDFLSFPMDHNDSFIPKNGRWQSESEFLVEIHALCEYVEGSNANAYANEGVYIFDFSKLEARWINNLP